ncbi:hypothetical protein J31TS4_39080 [Paenibacillus sp. J31TS4]|uniref:hypothetical protein n=1 Tax=Paenibacillus sp. J31TS4 TaxID=2807195 RepID=UPI001B255E42|nr:hypothetical protein [Paenibacillus sp. J31TS4]GIP40628.1 hypothetical protein J31TS4_39080 [Paenibacillus sp. J31TS4]
MRRRYTITLLFTALSLFLCFYHYLGFDPKNMMLFSLSVPLWFLTLFVDIRAINLFFAYVLTVASWALIGYIADRMVQIRETKKAQ